MYSTQSAFFSDIICHLIRFNFNLHSLREGIMCTFRMNHGFVIQLNFANINVSSIAKLLPVKSMVLVHIGTVQLRPLSFYLRHKGDCYTIPTSYFCIQKAWIQPKHLGVGVRLSFAADLVRTVEPRRSHKLLRFRLPLTWIYIKVSRSVLNKNSRVRKT